MNPLSFDHSLRLARGHRSTRAITPSPTFFVRIVVRLRRFEPPRIIENPARALLHPGLGSRREEGNPFYHCSSGNFDDRGARLPVFYGTKGGFSRGRVLRIFDISNTFQHLVRDTVCCLRTCTNTEDSFTRKEGEKSFLRSLNIESFEIIVCETRFRPSWNNKYRIDHFPRCKLFVWIIITIRVVVAFKRQSQGQLWRLTSLQFI